jgi:ribokinase
MPNILNFGSLNIDHVYEVDHFVRPGETIQSKSMNLFPGGKGMNQSIALAKAGATVFHAGKIGTDGQWLLDLLEDNQVNTKYIDKSGCITGTAFIQVDPTGENCIILDKGANGEITEEYIDYVLAHFHQGDIIVLQNELNMTECIMEKASKQGLQIALNPSPIDKKIRSFPLEKVTWLLLNEVEGYELTNETIPELMMKKLLLKYPDMKIVLTLGKDGSIYADQKQHYIQPIYPVKTVDTTGAGDTFTGYFLGGIAHGYPIKQCLDIAAKASSIAVTRKGAAVSIPLLSEVLCESECSTSFG